MYRVKYLDNKKDFYFSKKEKIKDIEKEIGKVFNLIPDTFILTIDDSTQVLDREKTLEDIQPTTLITVYVLSFPQK